MPTSSNEVIKMIQRQGVKIYYVLLAASISMSPDRADTLNWHCEEIISWLPAARRMLELSSFPTKTFAWLILSLAYSPFVFAHVVGRVNQSFYKQLKSDQIKKLLMAVGVTLLVLTPWLLTDFYRADMTRGGAVISGLGVSTWFLVFVGPVISVIYIWGYSAAIVVLVMLIRKMLEK